MRKIILIKGIPIIIIIGLLLFFQHSLIAATAGIPQYIVVSVYQGIYVLLPIAVAAIIIIMIL